MLKCNFLNITLRKILITVFCISVPDPIIVEETILKNLQNKNSEKFRTVYNSFKRKAPGLVSKFFPINSCRIRFINCSTQSMGRPIFGQYSAEK